MWGCTNLDETVYSGLPRDQYINSPQMFFSASGQAYSTLQNYCTEQSLWTLNMISSDECCVPINPSGEWGETRYQELQTHSFPVNNKLIRTGWDFVFDGIAACNDAIYEMNRSEAQFPERNKLISQVRLLRALYYYWAVDAWGNIPFSTDPTDKSMPPQKGRDYVVPFLITEITESIQHLDITRSTENYSRFTQGAANALLAKIYLNHQEWVGTAKWAEAEAACNAVFTSGAYSVESSYKANFEMGNQISGENMLSIPYDNVYTTSDNNGFTLHFWGLNQILASKFNITATVWDGFVCQPDFFTKYETGDTRRDDTWLFGQQYDINGNPIMTGGVNYVIDPQFPETTFPRFGGASTRRQSNQGARIWKWTYQIDGVLVDADNMIGMGNHFAIFRYADVLYMYAEALLRQSKDLNALLANADFQRIRTRAGLAPFTAGTLTLESLYTERGSEFAWESWRRNDMIRFGKYLGTGWSKPDVSSPTRKLYPLPEERRRVNPNLIQNDGYTN